MPGPVQTGKWLVAIVVSLTPTANNIMVQAVHCGPGSLHFGLAAVQTILSSRAVFFFNGFFREMYIDTVSVSISIYLSIYIFDDT